MLRVPSALYHRNFRWFYGGQFVSLIGSWMQTAALGWLVYTLTDSAFLLGMVTFVQSVPGLLLTMWGGVIADRYDKRVILYGTQTVQLCMAFLLYWLVYTHYVQYWHLVAIAFLQGLVNSVDVPTRQAFIVDLIEKKDLTSAIAINSSIFNATRIMGPALAGLLLAKWGTAGCFLVNGFSFIAPIWVLGKLELQPSKEAAAPTSAWDDLLVGLRYIRDTRPVRDLVALLGVTSLLGWGGMVTLPIFARDILHAGAAGYGFLMAASGVGALGGALVLSMSQTEPPSVQRRRVVGGILLFCAVTTGFAWSRNLNLSLCLQVVGGWAVIVYFATSNSWLQSMLPDHLRGRVMGFYHTMFQGLMPVGSFLTGAMAEHLGAPQALTIGMLACSLVALVAGYGRIGER